MNAEMLSPLVSMGKEVDIITQRSHPVGVSPLTNLTELCVECYAGVCARRERVVAGVGQVPWHQME